MEVISTIEIDGNGNGYSSFYGGDGYGRGEENVGISGALAGDGFGSSIRWSKSLRGDGCGFGEGDGEGYERNADKVVVNVTCLDPSDW